MEKINVSVQYPGLVHDARIVHKSPIFYHALYPPATYFLLRNGAYPCMEEPIGISYLHYFGTFTVVELAIGIMKICWPTKGLEVHPN